jgi:hypothetical protein
MIAPTPASGARHLSVVAFKKSWKRTALFAFMCISVFAALISAVALAVIRLSPPTLLPQGTCTWLGRAWFIAYACAKMLIFISMAIKTIQFRIEAENSKIVLSSVLLAFCILCVGLWTGYVSYRMDGQILENFGCVMVQRQVVNFGIYGLLDSTTAIVLLIMFLLPLDKRLNDTEDQPVESFVKKRWRYLLRETWVCGIITIGASEATFGLLVLMFYSKFYSNASYIGVSITIAEAAIGCFVNMFSSRRILTFIYCGESTPLYQEEDDRRSEPLLLTANSEMVTYQRESKDPEIARQGSTASISQDARNSKEVLIVRNSLEDDDDSEFDEEHRGRR